MLPDVEAIDMAFVHFPVSPTCMDEILFAFLVGQTSGGSR
jgi:hypothetical protein